MHIDHANACYILGTKYFQVLGAQTHRSGEVWATGSGILPGTSQALNSAASWVNLTLCAHISLFAWINDIKFMDGTQVSLPALHNRAEITLYVVNELAD